MAAKPLDSHCPISRREDVGRAAGGKADDDVCRPQGIDLRPSKARRGRERGNTSD